MNDLIEINILALHLGFGGIEKAVISTANMFSENDSYKVRIYSVYNMPGAPGFLLNENVEVNYLLDTIPNREEFKQSVREHNYFKALVEGVKAVKTLINKKCAVINVIKSIRSGVFITTRNEDNILLSKYGNKDVLKIAQLHHDHNFKKKLISDFRKKYSNVDIFTLLTPGLADEVRDLMCGYNSHTKIVFMPNFLERFPDRTNCENKEKVIITAGRLVAGKRVDALLRIFASVKTQIDDWKLKIVGDGEEMNNLVTLSDELGISDSVIFTGRKTGQETEQEFAKASIFAMTSENEGFGFVIIEGQSSYLPVVAYNTRVGAPMLVHDEIDGFLIPDNDAKLFGEKLVELAHSEDMRLRMGNSGAVNAKTYSKENVSRIWHSIIEDNICRNS